MNQIFPFGFDNPTAFYLTVYVLTLVLHAVPMSYVLAGSLWLSWSSLIPGRHELVRTKHPVAQLLRDWMPFALSGAITAGVAPLLFIQILYRQQFYTANLLLGWRWMIVIPVLVLAFYLLYVAKSKSIGQWMLPFRTGLTLSICACFLMVAFCWTANHLLSLQPASWPDSYVTGDVVASTTATVLRLLTWISGTIPVMAIVILWQFKSASVRSATYNLKVSESTWSELWQTGIRQLCIASTGALIVSAVCGTGYLFTIPAESRAALFSVAGLPWMVLLLIAQATQAALWFRQSRRVAEISMSTPILSLTSLLSLLSLLSTAVLRELIRLSQADLSQISTSTTRASQVGGFWLFATFAFVNTALIVWCTKPPSRPREGSAQPGEGPAQLH